MSARLCLAFLCLVGFVVGIWALVFPLSFYYDFPAAGHPWISLDGPYNEHLLRDVGGLNLSLGVLAGLGLSRPTLVTPFAVGVVTLPYNLPHFIYHLTHLSLYAPIDRAGNVIGLGTALLASFVLVSRGGAIRRSSVL